MGAMQRLVRVIGLALCALAATVLAPASGAADVEPNSSIFQPEGPVLETGPFTGTLSSSDADDWYVFHVNGVNQLHLKGALAKPECGTLRLTDRDGKPIASDFTSSPGVHRYFVRASLNVFGPCAETSYTFTVEPLTALVEGPGKLPFLGTGEPNDTRDEASGPLGPNAWHFSALETVNDVDWLRFYARPGRQRVQIEIAAYGSPCFGRQVNLTDANGVGIATGVPTQDGTLARLGYSSPRAQRLFVHIAGNGTEECIGAKTVLGVGPASAVYSPSEVRSACAAARRNERVLRRRVAAVRRALAHIGKPAPSRLVRKLRRDKRKLREARRLQRVYCS
jgi:hypothetical protein